MHIYLLFIICICICIFIYIFIFIYLFNYLPFIHKLPIIKYFCITKPIPDNANINLLETGFKWPNMYWFTPDYRTGPCFTKVTHGMCQGQLPGVACTKQLCCATIGKAWGHPCEHCPDRLNCQKGYLKNIHSGQCVGESFTLELPKQCQLY